MFDESMRAGANSTPSGWPPGRVTREVNALSLASLLDGPPILETRQRQRVALPQLLRLRQIRVVQIEIFLLDHFDIRRAFFQRSRESRRPCQRSQAGRRREVFFCKIGNLIARDGVDRRDVFDRASRGANRRSQDQKSGRRTPDSFPGRARNHQSGRPGAISVRRLSPGR